MRRDMRLQGRDLHQTPPDLSYSPSNDHEPVAFADGLKGRESEREIKSGNICIS